MPRRLISTSTGQWEAAVSGHTTQYGKDEFGIVFRRLGPDGAVLEERLARYSPRGAKNRELSLARLSDARLLELMGHSQPSFTAPELGYRR